MTVDARSRRFLEIVASYFCRHSSWPEVDHLQRSLVLTDDDEDLVVWDEIERLPGGFRRREPLPEGGELIVLTVFGLAHSGKARKELRMFIKLVHHFVEAWKNGRQEVLQSEFPAVLGVSRQLANRVATILQTEGLVGYASHATDSETTWRPSKNSIFQFRAVKSAEEYLAVVDRILGQPALLLPDAAPEESDSRDVLEIEAPLGQNAKSGFLLMPFVPDLDWLHGVIRRAGAEAGVRIHRADDISSPGVVLEQVFRAIDEGDVIISVCTGKNPNVFFEMGYAWRDHRVILIDEHSADLPFDVQHYRTVLYAGLEKNALEESIKRAIQSVLAEKRLPKGRRLASPPPVKSVARLGGRLEKSGKNHRLVLTNVGTLPVHEVMVELPPEATSLHVFTEDLPIKTLRPGQSVSLPATTVMAGGKGIFDIALRGVTDDGKQVEEFTTVSLYG